MKKNKQKINFFEENAIDIFTFLNNYCGIPQSKLSRTLSHRDVKKLFPDLKRCDFGFLLNQTELLFRGDVIMVKDTMGNCAPYYKPNIISFSQEDLLIKRVVEAIQYFQYQNSDGCIIVEQNNTLLDQFNDIRMSNIYDGVLITTLDQLIQDDICSMNAYKKVLEISKMSDSIFIIVDGSPKKISIIVNGTFKYDYSLNDIITLLIKERLLLNNQVNNKDDYIDHDSIVELNLEDSPLFELIILLNKCRRANQLSLYWRVRNEIVKRKKKNKKMKNKEQKTKIIIKEIKESFYD